tara:strand:+ start:21652 stop:22509 length:858 start_codon:yes stop_codon:yes gene_type:complete
MTTRNNKERLGSPASGTAHPDSSVPPTNLLEFVVPTEFVELPSGGEYYPEDHPLSGQQNIEIRFMTAKDEDTLTNKTLLKQGVALDRVLQNLLVDKNININDLLIGDKNAIVVAARRSAYGAAYETKVSCPACLVTAERTFDLSEVESVETTELEDLGITKNDDGTFTIVLPVTKLEATVKLMTGKDERHLASLISSKRKLQKDSDLTVTDQFKQFIVSVQGVEDKKQVAAFIDNMPANDSRFLRLAYKKLVPNIDLLRYFECGACGYEQEMEVPFTTDFFWPKL